MQQSSKIVGREVKEAIRLGREAYARYTSNKTRTGWEEYATARKNVE